MSQLAIVAIMSWLAGIAAFIGGVLARLEGTAETEGKREFVHGIVAFGGGILVAAVAFALAPKGMTDLSPVGLASTFCLGGVAFCYLDARLSKRGGSKAQFMAMLMDFVPEAIALGALFGHDHRTGILLALFIGAQNLPEGFNAYRESVAGRVSPRAALMGLLAISLLGPAAGCIGYLFLQSRPVLTASMMSFAGGGILYLIFQDIAPQSTMKRHWVPPLGAVLGFVIGMIGKQLLG
jgi:zinc transporter, ZIP family